MRFTLWILLIVASSAYWFNIGRDETELKIKDDLIACEAQLAINVAYISQRKEDREEANRLRDQAIASIYEEYNGAGNGTEQEWDGR